MPGSNSGYTELPTSRFERKFVFEHGDVSSAIHMIKRCPGGFDEIYQNRRINNIYFDTFDLRNFYDNHMGKSDRVKTRIRWYGEVQNKVNKPILEFKIKNGLLGRKKSYRLDSMTVNFPIEKDQIIENICSSDIPESVKEQTKLFLPTLYNTYSRRYFQSFDKRFRFTIDYDLSYFNPYSKPADFNRLKDSYRPIVIELKYDMEHDKDVHAITNALPLRLNKFSKYVSGIGLLNPHLAV